MARWGPSPWEPRKGGGNKTSFRGKGRKKGEALHEKERMGGKREKAATPEKKAYC